MSMFLLIYSVFFNVVGERCCGKLKFDGSVVRLWMDIQHIVPSNSGADKRDILLTQIHIWAQL